MGWIFRQKDKKDITKKKITLLDFFFAIRENGLPQARMSFWGNGLGEEVDRFEKEGVVNAACAIGQAALNLGTDWGTLEQVLSTKAHDVKSDIIRWNDTDGLSLQQIFDKLKEKYPSKFDIEIEFESNIDVIKS